MWMGEEHGTVRDEVLTGLQLGLLLWVVVQQLLRLLLGPLLVLPSPAGQWSLSARHS